jgi:hypothetical protein
VLSVLSGDPVKRLCALVLLTCATAGAASPFPIYPVRQATDYAVSAQAAPLIIAVEPVDDAKDQRFYFHAEIAPMGFVPVFVVIQNTSSEDSFLFDKMKVTYGDAAGVSTPKTGLKVGESLGLTAIPFVGMFSALSVVRSASEVQQHVLQQELKSTTLSPGASAHGFLYVPVPKKGARSKIHLRVPVARSGGDAPLVLDLIF